jgi:hypothetical protein
VSLRNKLTLGLLQIVFAGRFDHVSIVLVVFLNWHVGHGDSLIVLIIPNLLREEGEGGRRKEEGGRRKEEGGRRKEEGGRKSKHIRIQKDLVWKQGLQASSLPLVPPSYRSNYPPYSSLPSLHLLLSISLQLLPPLPLPLLPLLLPLPLPQRSSSNPASRKAADVA